MRPFDGLPVDRNKCLKRRTPLKRSGRLRPYTKKRKAGLDLYGKLRVEFLTANPSCGICHGRSSQIHHKRGRIGWRLCAEEFFLAICQECHTKVHENGRWARAIGYILPA